MVERARLTPRLVFEATCPAQGERWIADTKVKGFGLRLWSTKSGGQKAFAIRVRDHRSKWARRTFDASGSRNALLGNQESKYGLGQHLDEARRWAQDEIDKIKGRPTRDELTWLERRAMARLVRAMTLQRAADALLNGLKATAAEHYRDRLDKLFARHIPEKIKRTPLVRLDPKQMARVLVSAKTSPGNVRVLRSFISQIIERGASFDTPLRRFHSQFAAEFSAQWERSRDVRYPELRRFSPKKYEFIFHALESDDRYWQQAMAIRLYFAFRAPLSRILSAQWKQIYNGYWYPYLPKEKKFWFECRERIEQETQELLDHVKRLCNRDFETSQFLFPSRHSRNVDHIRTVEFAWQRALRKCHVRYYPLREFSRGFREFNNPSYYISFLREYGPMAREVQNAAEVSKALNARKIR